jgi:hypothetical protein
MKRRIIEIDNKKYLKDFYTNSLFEVKKIDDHPINGLFRFCCVIGNDRGGSLAMTKLSGTIEKWGCVNVNNEEMVSCIYDSIYHKKNKLLDVTYSYTTNSNAWDLKFNYSIDIEGVPVKDYLYDNNGTIKEGRTSFVGWQAIGEFWGDLAVGVKNGFLGVVFINGNELFEPEYEEIEFRPESNHIIAKKGDKIVTFLHFDLLDYWSDIPKEYSFVKYDDWQKLFFLKKDNLITVMDNDERIIIPPIYKELVLNDKVIIAKNELGKKGILSRQDFNKIILDFDFDDIESGSNFHLNSTDCLIISKDNKKGLFSVETESIVLEPIIDINIHIYANTFGEGLIGFKDNKYPFKDGFINLEGELVLLFEYDRIYRGFRNGKARIKNLYYWRDIDKHGNTIDEGETGRKDNPDDNYYSDLKSDTWDAMTDGMDGDFPGGDIDYD